jgi:NHL repeat
VVAAHTGTFYGIAMTAGHIYTVAGGGSGGLGDGGPATSAGLHGPQGVTVDGPGNLVIADSLNGRVRVVAVGTGTFYGKPMTGGNIYTVAGTGTRGFSGDGGAGTGADLSLSGGNGPDGVAVGPAGNLLIADVGTSRVRSVAG